MFDQVMERTMSAMMGESHVRQVEGFGIDRQRATTGHENEASFGVDVAKD